MIVCAHLCLVLCHCLDTWPESAPYDFRLVCSTLWHLKIPIFISFLFDRESRFIKENWERTPERDSKGGTLLMTVNLKLIYLFICACVCMHTCVLLVSWSMCEGQRTTCCPFFLSCGTWRLNSECQGGGNVPLPSESSHLLLFII